MHGQPPAGPSDDSTSGGPDSGGELSLADIEHAARRLDGAVLRTPLAEAPALSSWLGCSVSLKYETLQATGSYKERGARNHLAAIGAETPDVRVVTASAGNHGLALAFHAKALGMGATIVMPREAARTKIAQVRALGAKVVLHGDGLEAAMDHARTLIADDAIFVHPYDDPHVIAGAGTVGLEMLAEQRFDTIAVPVGGGGLMAGIAIAVASLCPDTELVGVRSQGTRGTASGGLALADGIAVDRLGSIPGEILGRFSSTELTVDEPEIESAICALVAKGKVVVEGAGAAGVAAIAANQSRFAGKRVGVVLTGANIDQRLLTSIISHDLARSGRVHRIRLVLDDRPNALAGALSDLGGAGANVVEVRHDRMFSTETANRTEVEVTLEVVDGVHLDDVLRSLAEGAATQASRVLRVDEPALTTPST